jgi:Protein of unknown function (DUF4232)
MNQNPGTTRRAIAAVALACVAAFVAACSHPSGSPASSAGTATASPASSATATPTPVPVSSPSGPAGPGPCPTQSLKVKPGVSQGTAGSVYTVIDFTNISHVTCTLYGYPGVSLTSGKPGAPIGQPAVENPATPRQLVTLQPNVTGNALLQIVDAQNYSPSRCGPVTAHYLKIYPPNQTTPVYLHYRTQACTKPVHLLTVDVVKPGSGSS